MILVSGVVSGVAGAPGSSAAAPLPPGGSYHALTPARVLDTRVGLGARKGIVSSGSSIVVQLGGRGGVPTSGVSAVVLNLTVTGGSRAGYALVYAAGSAKPLVSNINYTVGQTLANLAVTRLDGSGRVAVTVSGSTQVLADVQGWFSTAPTASSTTGLYHALPTAARIVDSRTSLGMSSPTAGSTRVLQVSGRGGVPAHGVAAVIVNITAVRPSASGYVTAFPSGQARPATSSLNFVKGDVRPNRVFARLSATGALSLYNVAGTTPLLVDVQGWFTDGSAGVDPAGGYFATVAPSRVLDTRIHVWDGFDVTPQLSAGPVVSGSVGGRNGVPSGAGSAYPVALLGNLTAVDASRPGYLTAFPHLGTVTYYENLAGQVPGTSDVNFAVSAATSNAAVITTHAGFLAVLTSSQAHVVLDVFGYFALATPSLALESLTPPDGNFYREALSMSSTGRYVAFREYVYPKVDGVGWQQRLLVRNRLTRTNITVPFVASIDHPYASVTSAAMSGDGRYVAFAVTDNGTGPNDGRNDAAFRYDLSTGTTVRVDVTSSGAVFTPKAGLDTWVFGISDDGSRIGFLSSADNVVAGLGTVTGSDRHYYVRDLTTPTTTEIDLLPSGQRLTDAGLAKLSADGSTAVFQDYNPANPGLPLPSYLRHIDALTTTQIPAELTKGRSPVAINADGTVVNMANEALITIATGVSTALPTGTFAVSGDGSTVLTESVPANGSLWSATPGGVIQAENVGTGTVTAIRGGDVFAGGSNFSCGALSRDGSVAVLRARASLLLEPAQDPADWNSPTDFVLPLR
jgi:hypothetical protein